MSNSVLKVVQQNRRAMKGGRPALGARQRGHLAEMVRFARDHSRFYREHYAGLPETVDRLDMLPSVTKPMLMERFDDWVTDPNVNFHDLQKFVADSDRAGEPYQSQYLVCSTSGTSGYRGVFLLDGYTTRIHSALGMRKFRSWAGLGDVWRILVHGARVGAVVATDDHFAAFAGIASTTKSSSGARRLIRVFSVHSPMHELVKQLNAWQPAILIGYARTVAQLAEEQAANRLAIKPVLVSVTAESLDRQEYHEISAAFGVRIHDNYGCTEAAELSYDCSEGWHHYNMDWHGFEPVDADYRPVPPGELSHTVLLTNLINRVQPILRYDLGDSVLMRPDACPCGNPLPAFRVMGRASQVMSLRKADGGSVAIAPMAFTGTLEKVRDAQQYQVVQLDEHSLKIRFTSRDDPESTWHDVMGAVRAMLVERGLENVKIEHADEPPQQTSGGKYMPVIPCQA